MSIDQITEYNIVFMHEFVMWTIYVILNHILVILLLLLKMTRLPWTISLNYFGDNFVQAWIEKWYQPWTIYVHVWIDKWCQPWTIYVILNHISVTVLLFWQVMSALNNWCHFEPYFGDTFVVLANDVSLEQFMSFWTIFKWQFCYFGKWCQPWMIHVILNHVLVTHYLNQQVMSALNNLCHYEPYFGDTFVVWIGKWCQPWLNVITMPCFYKLTSIQSLLAQLLLFCWNLVSQYCGMETEVQIMYFTVDFEFHWYSPYFMYPNWYKAGRGASCKEFN